MKRALSYTLVASIALVILVFGLRTGGQFWLSVRDSWAGLEAELQEIDVRGDAQWVLRRYREPQAPLVLFLHGGPGMPAMPLARYFERELPQEFLVVHWDQRGTGLSCRPGAWSEDPAAGRIDTYVEDALALTRALLERHDRQRLHLVAHSWGTILALHMIAKEPELFFSYTGIGQVIDMPAGEALSLRRAFELAQERGDADGLGVLQEIGEPPYDGYGGMLQQRAVLRRNGGAYYGRSGILDLMAAGAMSPEYSIPELLRTLDCEGRALAALWDPISEFRAADVVGRSFEIPVHFMMGDHDWMIPTPLARQYLASVQAPETRFTGFEYSGHAPNYEEPARFESVLIEWLRETTPPAQRSPE